MKIEFTINNKTTTVDADIPEKLYLRHDWNSKSVIRAENNSNAYSDDPKDMYHYSELISKNYPVESFFLCKQHQIIPVDMHVEEFQLLATHKSYELILDNDDIKVIEHLVAPAPELPEPNPDAILPVKITV